MNHAVVTIINCGQLRTNFGLLTPFFSMFPFDSFENTSETIRFLTFSGGSKGNFGKKWVNTFKLLEASHKCTEKKLLRILVEFQNFIEHLSLRIKIFTKMEIF